MIKNLNRNTQLNSFLKSFFGITPFSYQAITSDASFRQYYRVRTQVSSYILMDSPADLIDNAPFIGLRQDFEQSGLAVPKLVSSDLTLGFILLSDLGSIHLADCLEQPSRISDYQAILDLLPNVAAIPKSKWMKPYDADFIRLEINIFKEWLLENWLGLIVPIEYEAQWNNLTELLVENMLKQPQVTMHRDFHSRNIMKTGTNWALIDFQDAVQGPVCYDAVSLLKDCYFKLPQQEFKSLLAYNFKVMNQYNLLEGMSFGTYRSYFELTGLQRHLKAAGIFCRLLLRDNKAGYTTSILPTLAYVQAVLKQHQEFQGLATWFDDEIIPAIEQKIESLR
ncbi:aminoglycoside phosphotransferase family protein [Pseudoalteromonas phenolica]|uniref:aminoglycoside phosphotransferase family protein n=1 Tax=Pseudoalteromonas phenolica TaxID=161398 RepID=UPI001F0EB579|nr:phosphotransferase [Pseudoalteromonas phenolica]